jgi:hypothetical protein
MTTTPPDSLLAGINIDAEKGQQCADGIRCDVLKPIAAAFAKNAARGALRGLLYAGSSNQARGPRSPGVSSPRPAFAVLPPLPARPKGLRPRATERLILRPEGRISMKG